ncbi:MAG TPA: redoxin domain-containing protein [Gemmatimonadales bacterium]|nr:redoxin domain-containing protein [Gemmatimonadales bacterium]
MRAYTIALTFAALLAGTGPTAFAQKDSSVKAVIVGGPEVGRRAPDFSLPWANRDGVGPVESPYQLASDRGRTVVIAFYPRDFTKGCTAQMQTFGEQYDSLFGPDVTLVGISTDSVTTHSRFAASLKLPFRLLSDPEQRVSKQYASKDGGGYNRRTVYVIGPDGRVKYRNMKFNALDPRSYSELGAAVKSVRGS